MVENECRSIEVEEDRKDDNSSHEERCCCYVVDPCGCASACGCYQTTVCC